MANIEREHDDRAASRSLAGQLGAATSWANTTDRSARTAPARRAMEQSWLDKADGDPKRAEQMRKLHFLRMQQKSLEVRRLRARARQLTAEIDSQEAS